jgi:hypothetical protein
MATQASDARMHNDLLQCNPRSAMGGDCECPRGSIGRRDVGQRSAKQELFGFG